MKELLTMVRMEAMPFKIEAAAIMAFMEVETGGRGFAEDTGKILIQFEPVWYRKVTHYAPSGLWSVKRLGYESVHAMWNDAKLSLERQIWQICKFISTDIKLQSALKAHDWDGVASIYNGSGFRALAAKYGREPYDISMKNAYSTYKRL